ncbi:MAG: NAD(P)H-binding protein [Pseudomonadota bacterium]
MKRVLIVGATFHLGRELCAEYQLRGWYVIALNHEVEDATSIAADQLITARFDDPASLDGVMAGVDLVVSCIGIKHQPDVRDDGEMDYQSHYNLLREAEQAGVERFIYARTLKALDHEQVLCALDLTPAEQFHGARNSKDQLEGGFVEPSATSIHKLKIEREKL